ncbi:class I SAM-dependent methyltransferase [Mycobacterium spongiae]|uniref:Methyltransferase domain-containing protein n=1 Tax=Mycobacterium spongiae TaxID=886343 RepID=A0A975JYJ2_9MYCO|nr:class I SAM-dependent methyltransferase [Mycobacterium spongiae]QUR68064.1 methyltransferase domain-containing protein [Mycobacterium spongiae]
MTAAQRFTRKIAQRVSETRHVLRPVVRLRDQAEGLADYLARGDSLLDVGCGTGHLSAYLQDMYGVESSGVDVKDSRQVKIAFEHFDGTSISQPDKAFDHVVLSEVLHHSHDPLALIKECHRVARRSIIVFEDMPDGLLGKLILDVHVRSFARWHRYPFRPAPIGAYRAALQWLGDNGSCVARIPQPPEWFTVYPRVLFVYQIGA